MDVRFVWVVAALCIGAAEVRADSRARLWELAIPDLRYEFDDGFDDHDVALALPLIYAPWQLGVGARIEIIPGGVPGSVMAVERPVLVVVPELFFEPQYELTDGHARAVPGVRAFAIHGRTGAHALIEGMGTIGRDGAGAGFGVGLGFGSVASIGYRRMWTGASAHNALLFDVRLFVLPPSQPQRTLDEIGRYRGPYPASAAPEPSLDAPAP